MNPSTDPDHEFSRQLAELDESLAAVPGVSTHTSIFFTSPAAVSSIASRMTDAARESGEVHISSRLQRAGECLRLLELDRRRIHSHDDAEQKIGKAFDMHPRQTEIGR